MQSSFNIGVNLDNIFQIIRLKEYKQYDQMISSVSLDAVDEDNQTLLHEAVISGNEYVVNDLLERGIKPNIQDKNGLTPLHYAALYKQLYIAQVIIENGGDVNIVDSHGNNSLWTATFNARGTYYDMVELFVKASGDCHHKNKYGKSAFDFAKQINDKKLLQLFEACQ